MRAPSNALSGSWEDPTGGFFNGSIIEFGPDQTWKPQRPTGDVDRGSTYTWRTLNSTTWALIQVRENQERREYKATRNKEVLEVTLKTPSSTLAWTLHRTGKVTKGSVMKMIEEDALHNSQSRVTRIELLQNRGRRKRQWNDSRSQTLDFKSFVSQPQDGTSPATVIELFMCMATIANSIFLGQGMVMTPAEAVYNISLWPWRFVVETCLLVLLAASLAGKLAVAYLDTGLVRAASKVWNIFDAVMILLGVVETCFLVVLEIAPSLRTIVAFVAWNACVACVCYTSCGCRGSCLRQVFGLLLTRWGGC